MDQRVSGALLWLRASLLASMAFLVGAVGHVSAQGLLPSPPILAVLVAASVPLCAAQLTRPASTRRIVLMLAAGQTAVHLVLSVFGGHRGDSELLAARSGYVAALPTRDGPRAGSLLDGYEAVAGHHPGVEPAHSVGALAGELASHAPMMAAHLGAAALAGVWLSVGERSLFTLLALATDLLVGPRLVALAGLKLIDRGLPAMPVARAPHDHPTDLLLACCLSRRGPPTLLDT